MRIFAIVLKFQILVRCNQTVCFHQNNPVHSRHSTIVYSCIYAFVRRWKLYWMFSCGITDIGNKLYVCYPPLLKILSKMSMGFYLVHQIVVWEINSIWPALVVTIILSSVFTYLVNLENIRKYILKVGSL